jgi:hypothetical protein
MADRAQIGFSPAQVDSGDGATLAQAMRDEIAMMGVRGDPGFQREPRGGVLGREVAVARVRGETARRRG